MGAFKGFGYNANGQKNGYDAYATCTQEGRAPVNKYWRQGTSYVKCHDPRKFCKERFESSGENGALCDKSCNGNGRCQNVSYGGGSGGGDDGSGDDGDNGDGDNGDGDNGDGDDGDGDDDEYTKKLKRLLWKVGTYGYECTKKSSEFEQFVEYGHTRMAHHQSLRQISHKQSLNEKGNWQCWCYSNHLRTSGACSSIDSFF